ncbi:MAG: hypothetical protein LUE88_08565 [Clostridiales bacterium]|nr:hypothetical protein [Clostridiales bacterium]
MYTLIYILSDEEIMRNLIMLFASIFALYVLVIWLPAQSKKAKDEEKNKSAANFSAKVPPDEYDGDFDEDFNEDLDEYDPDLTSYSQNYYTPTSTYNNNNNKNNDEFYKRMAFTMAYINNRERQKAKAEERNAKRYRNSKSYKNSTSSTSSRRNKKR